MAVTCEVCGAYHGSVGDEDTCWRNERRRLTHENVRLKLRVTELEKERAQQSARYSTLVKDNMELAALVHGISHDKAAE